MFAVDPNSSTPVFAQLADCVTEGVKSGEVAPGTRLPPVRQLASDLGIAANTVAKAYRQLESEGHVATRGRNGTVVLDAPGAELGEATQAAAQLAAVAKSQGLTLEATVGVLRGQW